MLRSKQNFAEVEEMSALGENMLRPMTGHEIDSKVSDTFMAEHRLSLERFKPKEDQISPDCLCLMPHYVVGYAFHLRQWCKSMAS